MSGDGSMLDEFLTEAKEHLEAVESDLLAMDSEGVDDERIRRVFRAVHTIKGNAGFFGYKNTSTLAHRMEALLSLARDRVVTLEAEHVDVLLHGVDILRLLLDSGEQGDAQGIDEALARITALVEAAKRPAGPVVATAAPRQRRRATGAIAPPEPAAAGPGAAGPGAADPGVAGKASAPTAAADGTARKPVVSRSPAVWDPGQAAATGGPEGDGTVAVFRPDAQETGQVRITSTDEDRSDLARTGHLPPDQVQVGREQGQGGPGTVRVRLDILDELMTLAGELVLVRNQKLQQVGALDDRSRAIVQRLDTVTTALQATVVRTRMQPIDRIFSKFNRVVRDLGGQLGKRIRIEMSGNDVELDKTILEMLTQPLTHIIRNCCDHGIESPEERQAAGKDATGLIQLRAHHQGGQIIVRVTDDGRGIDRDAVRAKALEKGLRTADQLARVGPEELLSLVFAPGLTTATGVSAVSGRGVGMDVVKTSVERLGGVIELHSQVGRGTELVLRVPLTLAIIPCLIVACDGQRYAIPQVSVEEVVALYDDDVHTRIECAGTAEFYRLRDALLPMVRLSDVLAQREPMDEETRAHITERERVRRLDALDADRRVRAAGERAPVRQMIFTVLALGRTRYGLVIDEVLGMQEIVVKPLHRKLQSHAIYAGATVLGDGVVALILDALGVMRHAGVEFEGERVERSGRLPTGRPHQRQTRRLLLFASGAQEQFGVAVDRVRRIEQVDPSRIERVAGREFVTVEGRSTAVVRLDRVLPVSETVDRTQMYLVLVKGASPPWGVLASQVVDIGSYEIHVDEEAFRAEGVEATAIARGRMTLLLDLNIVAVAAGLGEARA